MHFGFLTRKPRTTRTQCLIMTYCTKWITYLGPITAIEKRRTSGSRGDIEE